MQEAALPAHAPKHRPFACGWRGQTVSEMLETRRQPPDPASGRRRLLIQLAGMVVSAAVLLGLAVGREGSGPELGVLAPSEQTAVHLLVLGDFAAGRESCAGCPAYVDQVALAIRQGGTPAYVDDRTWSGNAWPGATLAGMTGALRADPAAPEAVTAADLIVLAMGENDVRLVDGSRCGRRATTASSGAADPRCVEEGLDEIRRRLERLVAEITALRQDRPVALRVITPPPVGAAGRHRGHQRAVVARQRVSAAACDEVARLGGACVNLGQLVRDRTLTPEDGQSADGRLALSPRAHETIARELLALGLT